MATTAPHTERAHARLSPSSASRWTTCTASPGFVEANKNKCKFGSSPYADEGTEAHEIAEHWVMFLGGRDLLEPTGGTPEMHEHGKAYAEYVLGHTTSEDWAVEQVAPLWYEPESNGHVDYFAWNGWSLNEGTLPKEDGFHIDDYKYGKGVAVSAENNRQLSIYGAAIIFAQEIKNEVKYSDEIPVHLHIYQPRCQKFGDEGPASKWTTTWGELKAFVRDVVDQAVDVITNPNREHLRVFAPSEDTCRFCPAKAICEARVGWLLDGCVTLAPTLSSDELVLPQDVSVLDDEQLGYLLSRRVVINNLLDDVVEHAKARALAGDSIPGWKLVAGNGKRDWADEEKGAQLLKNKFSTDDIYTKKLISVAQAEKLLKGQEQSGKFKKRWEELVVRKEGQPLLVPESDKRQALTTAVDLLEDVTPEPNLMTALASLMNQTPEGFVEVDRIGPDAIILEALPGVDPAEAMAKHLAKVPEGFEPIPEPEVDFSCE